MTEIFNQFATLQHEKNRINTALDKLWDEVKKQLSETYFYYPDQDVFCKLNPSSQNILACGMLDYRVYVPILYGGVLCDKPCFSVLDGYKFDLTNIPRDLLFISKDEFYRQINLRLEKLKKEGDLNE